MLLCPPPFILPKISPALLYLGALPSAANSTTYALGNFVTDHDGLLIVGIAGRGGANRTVSSVTLGGTAASLHTNPSGDWNPSTITSKVVNAGSHSVSVTFSGGMQSMTAFGWILTGYNSATPNDTYGSNAGSGTSHTGNIDILADGIAVAVHMHVPTSATSWSGASSRADQTSEVRYSAADYQATIAEAAHNIQASWTTSESWAMSIAAWR
jgi:hypothetical protein